MERSWVAGDTYHLLLNDHFVLLSTNPADISGAETFSRLSTTFVAEGSLEGGDWQSVAYSFLFQEAVDLGSGALKVPFSPIRPLSWFHEHTC